jgi:tRNA G18 (ribose-2'-O)-methylase SpoU
LRPYRTLRRPREHLEQGLFVGEGEKVFDRMLAAGVEVRSALLTPEWLERKRAGLEAHASAAVVFVAPHEVLESVVGFNLHQGIMAVGSVPATTTLEQMIASAPPPRLLLALDGLANAENVGVVVRNAVAFGVSGIIVGETSSSPYLRRAVRNSMGAVFSLPVFHTANIADTLRSLRSSHNVAVFGLELTPASRDIGTTRLTGDVCLVVGSEGDGVRKEVIDACDAPLMIPMHHGVDSLNVANAVAVALYEVDRQRRREPSA